MENENWLVETFLNWNDELIRTSFITQRRYPVAESATRWNLHLQFDSNARLEITNGVNGTS